MDHWKGETIDFRLPCHRDRCSKHGNLADTSERRPKGVPGSRKCDALWCGGHDWVDGPELLQANPVPGHVVSVGARMVIESDMPHGLESFVEWTEVLLHLLIYYYTVSLTILCFVSWYLLFVPLEQINSDFLPSCAMQYCCKGSIESLNDCSTVATSDRTREMWPDKICTGPQEPPIEFESDLTLFLPFNRWFRLIHSLTLLTGNMNEVHSAESLLVNVYVSVVMICGFRLANCNGDDTSFLFFSQAFDSKRCSAASAGCVACALSHAQNGAKGSCSS